MAQELKKDIDSVVVEIKRVTRVVAGGKRMRFRALVVVGDRKGRIGVGVKKGVDVADAVGKATAQARKSMINVPLRNDTIPHMVVKKYKSAEIILKPAKAGAGIKAGGPIRAIIKLAGIKNITSKMLGSANKISNVRAVYEALQSLKNPNTEKQKNIGENL